MNYAALPLLFVKFWFYESPLNLLKFFLSLNTAFLQMFSMPLLVRTFFKPLKNEYRKGLVGFSRAMGIIVKSVLILADLVLFVLLIFCEICIFVGYVLFPFATIAVLFL